MKIIPAGTAHKVDQVFAVIYGPPGVGKTTLALGTDNPLLIDFDKGAARAMTRNTARVAPESWADVSSLPLARIKKDGYRTLVIDTIGTALDLLAAKLTEDSRLKDYVTGGLSLKGFGALKHAFGTWVKKARLSGLDVVAVCHSTEQRVADKTVVRLDVTGGTKDLLHQMAHVMGFMTMAGGKHVFKPSPSDAAFGKNPAQLADLVADPNETQLADFLAETKARLSAISNAPTEPVDVDLAAKLNNDLVALIEKKAPAAEKRKLMDRATSVGYAYDKASKQFVAAA